MRRMIKLGIVLSLAAASAPAAMPAAVPSVAVDGTEFVVTTRERRVLRSAELAGAILDIATAAGPLRLRIDAVERDPQATSGAVWLHQFSVPDGAGGWRNLCESGPDGRRQGFPLAFRPGSDAAMEPAPSGIFELTCTGGARGKCVRFGYLPWQGATMLSLYNACIRMVRADYCGDGVGTTRSGMRIDLYDNRGIQAPEDEPGQEFEAGWTEKGAVCVRHVRVTENTSLRALAKSCPRLTERLGSDCTEAEARNLGAVLFNRSSP